MHQESLDRWLLINYAGYPYAPSSLMPDNGLAVLAAMLLRAGKQVQILDYSTVTTLGKFASRESMRRLRRAWRAAFPEDGQAVPLHARLQILWDLHYGEGQRAKTQKRLVHEIAEDLVRHIQKDRIQAVGFKLWNGDGILGSVAIARTIRRRCPGVRIFGGGPQVDIFMEHILEHFDVFDAVSHGEGEETIIGLAESGNNPDALGSIPNLLFPDNNGTVAASPSRIVENLDDIPPPVYAPEVYPAMAGNEKMRIMVIDESRGCRNNCAFCIHPVKSDHNLRTRSVPKLIEEIENLRSRYHTHTFRFAGSCTPYDLFTDFAKELLAHGDEWRYASFAHVRGGDTADFSTMRKSGCVALFFGVESGSQKVLDGMRKGIKAETIATTFRRAREADIFTVASLIFPAPFDDEQTRRETLDVLKQSQPDAVTVQPAGVVPRTDWFNNPERYGISFRNRDKYVDQAISYKLKLLLPPALWPSLPVRIDGTKWKQTLKGTAALVRDLEKAGMVSAASHDTYLMSVCANMDVKTLRDEMRQSLMAGDAERIGELVGTINAGC